MPFSSARRRFVSISLRNSHRTAAASAAMSAITATATMRTAVAATRRSVYTSDSRWFRTTATAAAPLQTMSPRVLPNATASTQTSTSMRGYGSVYQKNNLRLFPFQKSHSMPSISTTKLSYSTTVPVAAAAVEAATETATASAEPPQRWSELLFGGILAVAFSATLVLGFPQTAQATAAAPVTVEATSPATSSSSNNSSSSTGPRHMTRMAFLPTPKSHNSGGNHKSNGGGSGSQGDAASSVVLSNMPLEVANNNNNSQTQMAPRVVTNSGRAPYDISVRAIRGGRMTMEDRFFVATGGKFVAVFDGHGGAGVSEFLKEHLYENVCHYLQLKHGEEGDEVVNRSIPSVSSQAGALRAAFEQVESDVIANDMLKYQGSTAVAVVVHEGDDGHRTLMSANVGDSRAILSRKGKAVDLTRDHKPSDEREKQRILAMGEEIEWDNFSKVHRVRSLSLSRAIGDRYAKPAVSSKVEIRHFSVAEEGDEFVLLASDGLWDVMTSQEVVSFVKERLDGELAHEEWRDRDESGDEDLYLRENMAKFVAREAIRRGSGDNVCVVLVFLNDPKPKQDTLSKNE